MPTARNARTAAKLTEEINEVTLEQDTAVAQFRKKKRNLNDEFNKASAREAAQKKLDQMGTVEKAEFAKLLKEGN